MLGVNPVTISHDWIDSSAITAGLGFTGAHLVDCCFTLAQSDVP